MNEQQYKTWYRVNCDYIVTQVTVSKETEKSLWIIKLDSWSNEPKEKRVSKHSEIADYFDNAKDAYEYALKHLKSKRSRYMTLLDEADKLINECITAINQLN